MPLSISIFDKVYSPPDVIRCDLLRNMRLGDRSLQIVEFLKFCDEKGILLKSPPLQETQQFVVLDKARKEKIKKFNLSDNSENWFVFLSNTPFSDVNKSPKEYFRDNMLAGQKSSTAMKDNQLGEFGRLLNAAFNTSDLSFEKKQAALFEKVYGEFIGTDITELRTLVNIEKFVSKNFKEDSKWVQSLPKDQKEFILNDLSRLAGLLLNAPLSYRYLTKLDMLLESVASDSLRQSDTYKNIRSDIDKLYEKNEFNLVDVGFLIYKVYLNKNEIFVSKKASNQNDKKFSFNELKSRFFDFIENKLFNKPIDPNGFEKSENFIEFDKLMKESCADIYKFSLKEKTKFFLGKAKVNVEEGVRDIKGAFLRFNFLNKMNKETMVNKTSSVETKKNDLITKKRPGL